MYPLSHKRGRKDCKLLHYVVVGVVKEVRVVPCDGEGERSVFPPHGSQHNLQALHWLGRLRPKNTQRA